MSLPASFYNKLLQVCRNLSMKPEDLLAVMFYESGLNPKAHNKNGNASGLIQFMPTTLKGLNYKGTHSDFRELDAEAQLDYVQKYIASQMKFNGGPFTSATDYYVANFFPVALQLPGVKAKDPNTAIVEKNPKYKKYAHIAPKLTLAEEIAAYNANPSLDVDKDGVISYGDLQRVMGFSITNSNYTKILQDLKNSTGYNPKPPPEKQYAMNYKHNKSKSKQDLLNSLEQKVKSFFSAFASQKDTCVIICNGNTDADNYYFAKNLVLAAER